MTWLGHARRSTWRDRASRSWLGKLSGLASVRATAETLDLSVSDVEARELLELVRKVSLETKRSVSDERFGAMAGSVVGHASNDD